MGTRYKVLHVINGRSLRGAEVFALQLASRMEQHGRLTNAVCSLYSGSGLQTDGNLPLVHLNGNPSLAMKSSKLDLLRAYRLYCAMRYYSPHIVLAHGSETLKYSVVSGALYRKAAVVYRNIGIASFWSNSRAKALLNRLLLRTTAAIISVSEEAREDIVNHYRLAGARVIYIPNGRETADFHEPTLRLARQDVRRSLGLQEADLAMVNVASLSPEKNQADLLRLTADLCACGLPVFVLLVGDGPLKEELARLSRSLGIAERVHFLGARDDVPKVLASADLFVLTSKTEGMPGVLIEAGLAGLASVAYRVGGTAEVLAHGDGGLVLPPGNYDELVRAVAELLSDRGRRARMGHQARQICLERFDMAKVSLAYERALMKVLKGIGGLRDGAA